jgi:hypothetical protein
VQALQEIIRVDGKLIQGIQDTGHVFKAHGGSLITEPSATSTFPLGPLPSRQDSAPPGCSRRVRDTRVLRSC